MKQLPVSREEMLRRRRRRQRRCLLFLFVCCLIAFFCGKMVGKAEKKQQINAMLGGEAPLVQPETLKKDAGGAEGKAEETDAEEYSSTDSQDIILVNRDNPLPEDYQVELVTLQDGVHQSAKEAYGALCDMLRAGIREGLTFEICSAYRSVERQRQLFDEDVNELVARGWSYEEAYEEVARETMPPGCSEHSTGLAFDIVALDYQMLDAGQEKTAENIWLREHCAEYGFILRYPNGTEDITGISYESWHFRYVGTEAAEYIMEQGITLEEYLQQ